MGKYLRKSKGIGEVAVMEVAEIGVKMTRPREVVDAEEPVVVKKRKIGEDEMKPSSPAPSLLQLENNDRGSVIPENSVSPERLDHAQASCCSSNESSELTKETLKFVDLEEDGVDIATSKCNSECAESGQTTPLRELGTESGKLVSTAVQPEELNSLLKSTLEKMPSDEELEDFFSAAEQKIAKEFAEKYNFDFQNDKPLEGRWEWVQVSQP